MNEWAWVGLASGTAGLGLGALICWLWSSRSLREARLAATDSVQIAQQAFHREATARAVAEERASRYDQAEAALSGLRAALDEERRANAALRTAVEKEAELREKLLAAQKASERQLAEHFGALSREVLSQSTATLLETARTELARQREASQGELETRHARFEELVRPFKDSLERLDGKVQALETVRAGAYESLLREVQSMRESQELVRTEAGNLVKALRRPHVRGLWGEMQLRRVVEMALMEKHCSFVEQETSSDSEGKVFRPDLIVRMPGGRNVVVDAKTPCAAYLDALEAPDDSTRSLHLKNHARQVAEKIQELSDREYAAHVEGTLELVVLFLPAESFLSAAFEQDPTLIEAAFQKNVVLATPMTLMALLKAIAYGWKQQDIAKHAEEVASLGSQLHDRLCTLADRFNSVGQGLKRAVSAYNETVGSLESRVLSTARRFKELNTVKSEKILPELQEVGVDVRLPAEPPVTS